MRRLPSGVPRRFSDHRRPAGVLYREHYRQLESELGSFTGSEILRGLAADAAAIKVRLIVSEKAWEEATAARQRGRGRRPSESNIRALAKRCGLEQQSYAAALDRLMKAVERLRPRTASPSQLLREIGRAPQPA